MRAIPGLEDLLRLPETPSTYGWWTDLGEEGLRGGAGEITEHEEDGLIGGRMALLGLSWARAGVAQLATTAWTWQGGRWKGEAGMSSPCTLYYVREENGGRGGSRGAWWTRKWKWDKTMHCIYA